MEKLVIILLLLSVTRYCLVQAQIPKVCSSKNNLTNRTCCPVPTNITGALNECGNNLGRGECRPVSSYCYTDYPNNGNDSRRNWPSFFFNRTCHCNGNYAGYDCGECKFGYEGDDCNTKSSLRQRQSIMNMTDDEWEDYNRKITRSKYEESRYVILLFNETDGNAFNAKVVNISLYNIFTWMHHYVAKNNVENYTITGSANDYAHESTGFLTWHRLFLLWFEREMQILLKDPSFTIRYWNWTNTDDRTSIFSFNKLGSNSDDGTVDSKYYGADNWESICWFPFNSTKKHQTCNPTDLDGMRPIVRCPSPTQCTDDYSKWPSQQTINRALNMSSYSHGPYNKYSKNAFSNFLEGFEPHPSDSENLEINSQDGIARHLHNLVHIILGIGNFSNLDLVKHGTLNDGTMGDVAASPNDPVFINHHTMVDYIFEKWLQKYQQNWLRLIVYGNYGGPKNDPKFAGHSANDCIVPFIPVYTHMDMFKQAENFGYFYSGVTGIKGGFYLTVFLMLVSTLMGLYNM